jgi:hypothetical protein
MNSIALSSIVLACIFGGALFGMCLPQLLPEDHLSVKSTDVVKLGIGLIGTMAAMVLGLMLSSAKGSYDTEKGELNAMSAKLVLLDRVLAHYGPDAKEARNALHGTVDLLLDQGWSEHRSLHSHPESSIGSEDLYDRVQELSPKNDEQRIAKSQAVNMVMNLGGTRWLMLEQRDNSVSMPLLIVLVSWLTIIFISFGLLAPRNGTVVGTLFASALSVSSAIFLILELYSPLTGVIRLSSAPLRSAMAHLGQ